MRQDKLIPQKGERALIVGQTGMGKTAFVAWMLVRIPLAPIIIYDTKDEEKFPKLPNSVIVSNMADADKETTNQEIDYIIVRPPAEMIGHSDELDDMLFYHYMNFRNIPAYIDEGAQFMRNGMAGKGMLNLMQRGRSRGITTIVSSQRPVRIDRSIITEAQKVYVFRLGDAADRKRLSDVIPNFDKLPLPVKHAYYFFESGEDTAQLMKPVKLDPSFNTGYVDAAPEVPEQTPSGTTSPGTVHVWV